VGVAVECSPGWDLAVMFLRTPPARPRLDGLHGPVGGALGLNALALAKGQ